MTNWLFALGGAAVGGLAGYFIASSVYEKKMIEQINSIKESYESRVQHLELKYDAKLDHEKEERSKYEDLVKAYSTDAEAPKAKEVDEVVSLGNDIRPITKEEFEQDEDDGTVDVVSWTYYGDGVLADERNEVVGADEIKEDVGTDFYKLFNDPKYTDEDIVYIHNERFGIDYEIVHTSNAYSATYC